MGLDLKYIPNLLRDAANADDAAFARVMVKGALKGGLSLEDVAILVSAKKAEQTDAIYKLAAKIKDEIYGERLVLFAPLYVSDYCVNDCLYCNFHQTNEQHKRRRLSMSEVEGETRCLIQMGHKRVLVEFGEDPDFNNIDYICESIRAIYRAKVTGNNIRRVNVNIAATTVENYQKLKAEKIGTYQLFQETYHRPTYEELHKGPKGNFERQLYAHDRAREAGLDDLGIGVLFGLYDWRFEVLALIAHADYMEKNLGVGPHTISVPRFRPAPGVNYQPEYPVSDEDFLKLIAILRVAVPYTGIILSTRELAKLRQMAFKLGVSQASAASICVPGGYGDHYQSPSPLPARQSFSGGMGEGRGEGDGGQFEIQDDRSVNEVVKSVIEDGLIPSFCTACYRVGRTGESFMELAKPGEIHNFCRPNAILTFAEYLEDFADKDSKIKGRALIQKHLSMIDDQKLLQETKRRLDEIKSGKRDLYF